MAEEQAPVLDENQRRVAQKVMDMAPNYGVNPDFALAVAMAENMFKNKTSEKGAIGPMQLLPATAKGLKVDPYDEDDNIKGGLMLIKQLTENKQIGLDPIRVLAGYHSGLDLNFFKTNNPDDLGQKALQYISNVSDFSGGKLPPVLYTKEMAEAPPEPSAATGGNGTVVVSDADMEKQAAEKRLDFMKAAGALGGAGLSASADTTGRVYNKVADILSGKPAGSLPTAAPPAPPPMATAAPVEPMMSPSQMASSSSAPSSAQATRILQGGQGDTLGSTGRARQEGYMIEGSQRSANRGEVEKITPQVKQVLAKMPGLTATESGVLVPRSEPRPTAGPRPQPSALTVRGGVPYQPPPSDPLAGVRPGGDPVMGAPMEQVPPRPAGALPPPKPSMTRQAIDMGRKAINMPVLGPAFTGALGGYSAVTQANDASERLNRGDYLGAGISGIGALGSAAAVIPHPLTRGIGGGLAMAAPMANMIVDYMRQTSPLSQARPTGR